MNVLETALPPGGIDALRRQELALRHEISVAKQKMVGLQTAINTREQSLARLQARIAMAIPARQAAPAFAG